MAKTASSPGKAVKTEPKKWVYLFAEGNAKMRDLFGGKGAGVAEMTRAGLPVPPGFTITTEACNEYYRAGKQFPQGLWDQALAALKTVEEQTGKGFGDTQNPLLVSVRSGAKFSMPGMMDTVLNLGLNDDTVKGIIALTGDEHFGYDSYRRFIQMFSKIVLDIEPKLFEAKLEQARHTANVQTDAEIPAEALQAMVGDFKQIAEQHSGKPFPTDPYEQLRLAIQAVFSSWNNDRAFTYRNVQKIPHDLGTAVNVQTMVFGNMGWDSGTGVAFTRDPNTGEKHLYAEYLPNAQGEDVVAGIRTPLKISDLEERMPDVYKEFAAIANQMEQHYRDMQDLEFTVEKGRLFMLQTRSAKRTAAAAVKIAVDMEREGLISKSEAVLRVEPAQVVQLLLPRFDPPAKAAAIDEGRLWAKGLNASPGAAYGKAVFDANTAEAWGKAGQRVVLVRPETSPDDVHGMVAAKGILTARGGATSHAAVVARGFGLPCVAGCEAIRVDDEQKLLTVIKTGQTLREGDPIAIDGSTGEVFAGEIATIDPNFDEEVDLRALLDWADEFARMQSWANADDPPSAALAVKHGAKGIGLCRTEHMFFGDRLPIVRRMILAPSREARQVVLDELLPIQRGDFAGLFRAMRDPQTGAAYPVVIRLIDPPLHEFLPSLENLLVEVTKLEAQGEETAELTEKRQLLQTVKDLHEANPMLGLRGCRLGLLYPEINVMQTRAILEAAAEVAQEGIKAKPKIMIPLVGFVTELAEVQRQLQEAAEEVVKATGTTVDYKFGTMIELPRAALTAGKIAGVAEFFSFGTNDLTQTTLGISRDDAEGKFLLKYVDGLPKVDVNGAVLKDAEGKDERVKILTSNPFQSIDVEGVGRLVEIGVREGRATKPELEVGVCGEHGGDPDSIAFFETVGLNYVSCSPFRVPVARLAAAQAKLQGETRDK